MYYTALILTILWGIIYLFTRAKLSSGKIYFLFLFMMAIPSFFELEFLEKYIEAPIDYANIFTLGILLLIGFSPWYYFDKHFSRDCIISVDDRYISTLKHIFVFVIIGSIISILYLLPYAIQSMAIGAADIREYIQDESPLPDNILTTICVGFAALHIYCILFFYISYLTDELKHYRFWLFVSSLSYIVNCMSITARDGFIILPCFYVIFYLIFRNSIPSFNRTRIKRALTIIIGGAIIFISIFTVNRFYDKYHDTTKLMDGTIGYIAQQPYVFDSTVKLQDDFHGYEVRFPLVNRAMGIEKHDVDRLDTWYETCFGTMYADFYNIGGWTSVVLVLLIFTLYFRLAMGYCNRNNKPFALILIFTVYLYIVFTGIFYCKAGSSISMNVFYIVLSIMPLFIGNYIKLSSNYADNRNTNY